MGATEQLFPLWHGHAHMPSVKADRRVIVRGEDAFVWDSTGRRLLDLPAGLWYCNVGHGRLEIAVAVREQLATLAAYSNFGPYATGPALALAWRLAELAPLAEPRVFFTSGGSDAIEAAAKLVRRYWQEVGRPDKQVLVSRTRSYHGLHGFGTSIAGLETNAAGYGPLIREVEVVPHDDWRAFEALLVEGGAERIAAIFVEPVIGAGGVHPPASGYLENVQRLCREHDVLLVVDEVVTGFGRLGEMFASTGYGLDPDLLVFAKGVTSGYQPLGGLIVGARVAAPFWEDGSELIFRHGLTYQAHAAACAAGLVCLDILDQEHLVKASAILGPDLLEELEDLNGHPEVVEVRGGKGLMAGIEFKDAATAAAVAESCWHRGVITRQIGLGETLQVSPPLSISHGDLRWGCRELSSAVAEVGERSLA